MNVVKTRDAKIHINSTNAHSIVAEKMSKILIAVLVLTLLATVLDQGYAFNTEEPSASKEFSPKEHLVGDRAARYQKEFLEMGNKMEARVKWPGISTLRSAKSAVQDQQ